MEEKLYLWNYFQSKTKQQRKGICRRETGVIAIRVKERKQILFIGMRWLNFELEISLPGKFVTVKEKSKTKQQTILRGKNWNKSIPDNGTYTHTHMHTKT